MFADDERFKYMVEDSQDWFWEFDENANFTYVSPRIRDLPGYEPEELLGLNAFDLMDADEAGRVRRHFDPLAQKDLPFNNLININTHKDGHKVVIEPVQMPVMDGLEAIGKIRDMEKAGGGHLPVIALIAHAMEKDRIEMLSKGFDGYVSKPMKVNELLDEVKRCLALLQ